jgi:Uma2 family endonuclease
MTPMVPPNPDLVRFYEQAEQEYLRNLPLEHFMEAYAQGTQRQITLASFGLIRAIRPDVQCFNELLVQYPRPEGNRLGQVVPDNMVVIHPEPIQVRGSFNLPLQPVRPFLMLEYVSKYNMRKDYEGNLLKYQDYLKVPCYLLFYPDNEELTVFRMAGDRYVSVTPNAAGRLPIPELELEAAILDGWVRYWFRGELLPLPGDLLRQLNDVRGQLIAERQARLAAEQQAVAAKQAQQAAEKQAATEKHARLAAEQQAEAEKQARLAAEQRAEAEIVRLRDELARAKGPSP